MLTANVDEGPVCSVSAFHWGDHGGGGSHVMAAALAPAPSSCDASRSGAGNPDGTGTGGKNLRRNPRSQERRSSGSRSSGSRSSGSRSSGSRSSGSRSSGSRSLEQFYELAVEPAAPQATKIYRLVRFWVRTGPGNTVGFQVCHLRLSLLLSAKLRLLTVLILMTPSCSTAWPPTRSGCPA
jgi:hypothetical protein